MRPLELFVAIRTGRGLNDRMHWRARAARVKAERESIWRAWRAAGGHNWRLEYLGPVKVLLTRHAPSQGLDDDNLRGSLKAIRDAIADELRVDDGDRKAVVWDYEQRRGPWGVHVEVTRG